MPKSSIELTEAEWAIMKAVWEHEPCAAPTIQEALIQQREWAYSTVRTLMDRMVAKGLLTVEKVRHVSVYRAAVTRSNAQQGELLYALKNAFDGALTPMLQCMLEAKQLTANELAEIEGLLKAARRRKTKP